MHITLILVLMLGTSVTGFTHRLSEIVKLRESAGQEIRAGHYQRAQEIYEQLIGQLKDDARFPHELALSWAGLGNVYRETGQLDKAESCLRNAEQIFRKLPDQKVELAVVLDDLAGIYRFKGQATLAEPLEQANKRLIISSLISLAAKSSDRAETARAKNNICVLYISLKDLKTARKYCDESLQMRRSLADNDADIGETLMNEAAIEQLHGRPQSALEIGVRALALTEGKLGPSNPGLALILDNLGASCLAARNYQCAEAYLGRSLLIREKNALEPLAIARSLNALASVYIRIKTYDRAEPLLVRAVAIRNSQPGAKDSDLVVILENYSLVLRELGRLHEAETVTAEMKAVKAALLLTVRAR